MLAREVVYISFFFLCFANGECNCGSKITCAECIQEIDCAWCIDPLSNNGSNVEVIHCRPTNSTSKWCASQVISPIGIYKEKEDLDFSETDENTIQLKPQRIKLSLRKGQKYDVKFKFKNTANYPVDLYYLMDLSKSMETHKNTLGEIGNTLAHTMRSLTNKFMIGFGSFIDKVELPFTSTEEKRLKNPCGTDNVCASPYSFKNVLPLTTDEGEFVRQVKAANVSGNLDAPEGGLDALMQAMVCEDIKWRNQTRHILVFSTDAEFHLAGDGKLVGAIEPNPGICYKNVSDYLKYDYPSVSQINYVAKEQNINIIFAIANKKFSYKTLSENIDNSNFKELNGKNIVDLIVEYYHKITGTVKFKATASDEIDVQFSTNCSDNTGIMDRCNDVHVNDVLHFTATIELRSCPKNGENKKLISIQPDGLDEKLIIELEMLCDCDCNSITNNTFELNSDKCNKYGNLTCGVCSCDPGRSGVNCECDGTQSKYNNDEKCTAKGSIEPCSGRGKCICDKCVCNAGYSEKYCECDNLHCKSIRGLMCSNRGECKCNVCNCKSGYKGEACECEISDNGCRSPSNPKQVCSGNGKCVCGHCECYNTDKRYTGKYCEECISCPPKRCEELFPCVQCKVLQKTCNESCFPVALLSKIEYDDNYEYKKCKILEGDCYIHFDYYYQDKEKNENLIVRALNKKFCEPPPNVLAWILIVIATILVAGLIMLLIWKTVTTVHDRREYAKFETEQRKLKWQDNQNPLYKEATSTFANPAYQRSSVRVSFGKN